MHKVILATSNSGLERVRDKGILDLALTQGELTVQSIADYMLCAQRSAIQDRAPHRTSPLTSLKALRWCARLIEWQELGDCMATPIISSYGHSTACKDKRESYPVLLAIVVAFERCVCDSNTPPCMALFLRATLLCVHGSIRFGDAQRMPCDSLQLSATAPQKTCDQTKTTKQGQPFAVTLHGLSRRDTASCWVLHWLGHLARHMRSIKAHSPAPLGRKASQVRHRQATLAPCSISAGQRNVRHC